MTAAQPMGASPVGPGEIADWLAYRGAASPDRTALSAGGRTWTYAQLDTDATALARQLGALGVRPGDRVASLLPNTPGAVVLVHAALRLGATLVPLNLRLSDAELSWQVADSGAAWLVVDERTQAAAARAVGESSRIPIVVLRASAPGNVLLGSETGWNDRDAPSGSGEGEPASGIPLRLVHSPSHVLAIIYTSGTTGRPRGAELTVGNFWWSAIGSALNLGAHFDDRWLAVLPLFHVGGLSIVIRAPIHGMTVVLHERFDAGDANRAIADEGVTIVSLVSVMLQRMLEERHGRAYPPSLRCVLLGGGPAPLPLLERSSALAVPVVQTYGLTEACSQVATLAPEDAVRKRGAAGRPLYPNAIRIVNADDSPAATGQPGEILVSGPIVMSGYAGNPEATAAAIVDGWLHTGDIGSLDAEGYLYVHDRRDDLIVTGGENVYPAEVEAALLAHPLVEEAAVVGMPDATWGQCVVAVVRLRGTPGEKDSADALRAHCRAGLAGYKVPSDIRITTDPLPRTASGKLRRGELRGTL